MNLEKEKYIKVRRAQANGARTLDELLNISDIVIENDTERLEIEAILKVACRCRNATIADIVTLVENGSDTLEKVNETINIFDACRRCKPIIQNIIDNKR